MSDVAIRVDGLSKAYCLGQVSKGGGAGLQDRMLREELRNLVTKIGRRPWHPLSSRATLRTSKSEIFWALKDVSFEIKQGELVGIIGRNGAGKSTLLKILSRITEPTEGRAEIYGRVGSLLEVGTGFHPELTGRENIYLNGSILGMRRSEITRKLDEIIAFAEIEKFIDTPVKRYSSGMYVRLAFSVAAHLQPEILFVDEVLAVGDTSFQKKCLGKMGDVAREGRTVLFVSHNMAAVENLCRRGILIQMGKVGFIGTQAEAIFHYMANLHEGGRSLKDLNNRVGSGAVRATDIILRDEYGNRLSAVQSGQRVNICLYFVAGSDYCGGNVRVGLTITSRQGVKVFSHTSQVSGDDFRRLPPEGAFVCTIHRLPLPASSYQLGFEIKVDEAYSDVIADAFDLDVVEGDFWGTGRALPASAGVCLVDADWKLEGA